MQDKERRYLEKGNVFFTRSLKMKYERNHASILDEKNQKIDS